MLVKFLPTGSGSLTSSMESSYRVRKMKTASCYFIFIVIVLSINVVSNTNTDSPTVIMRSAIKYYVLIGSISIILCWIAWTCWIVAAERQVRRIRFALFRNILRQEIGWFDVHNAGELSNRLMNDLGKSI